MEEKMKCPRSFSDKDVERIDMRQYDAGERTSFAGLFKGCVNLKEVSWEGFECGSVTDLSSMFEGCRSLVRADLSALNLADVKDMSYMFSGCESLEEVKFPKLEIKAPEYIDGLFHACSSLKRADLSTIDTSGVTSYDEIFSGCTSLESVNLNGFDLTAGEDFYAMFDGCRNLKTIKLYGCSSETVNIIKRLVYETLYLTGYQYPCPRPVFETDAVTECHVEELRLVCRCGEVGSEPLTLNAQADIVAYHNCIELAEGRPVVGESVRAIVEFPVFGRVGDILAFDFAEDSYDEPLHFLVGRLTDIVYMAGRRAIVDMEILRTGDVGSLIGSVGSQSVDATAYRYEPPRGDLRIPKVKSVSAGIHKLSNSYGGGDVINTDYILTDEQGIDHLIKSDYTDFHASTSYMGDKILGYHKNAPWVINRD